MKDFFKVTREDGNFSWINYKFITSITPIGGGLSRIRNDGGYEYIVRHDVDELFSKIQDAEEGLEDVLCRSVWVRDDIVAAFEENEEDPETLEQLVDEFIAENRHSLNKSLSEWLAQCGNESLATMCGEWMMEREKRTVNS